MSLCNTQYTRFLSDIYVTSKSYNVLFLCASDHEKVHYK